MLSQSLAERRAEIDYPCVWQYKIIGMDRKAIEAAVAGLLGDSPYSLSISKKSGAGKYLSMNLEVTVINDEQRQALYQALAGHPEIKAVL